MILKIIGWFWVSSGVIFLIFPEFFRSLLKLKGYWKIKHWFFGIACLMGFLLIKATWDKPGLAAKVLMICGVIAIFKGVFYLKHKAAERLIEWITNQPQSNLRLWATAQIVFGGFILWVK
jgi:uncharacterized protein YjeT (DUF2065 family)